jgi:hypothetical protein
MCGQPRRSHCDRAGAASVDRAASAQPPGRGYSSSLNRPLRIRSASSPRVWMSSFR